jgi:LysM repeat protein
MAITIGDFTITAVPTAAARAKRAFVVLVLLAGIALVAPYAVANDTPSTVVTDTWTVAEGETLWSIATAYTSPGDNVRETLQQIMAMNALDSTAIRAGDQLLVPSLD